LAQREGYADPDGELQRRIAFQESIERQQHFHFQMESSGMGVNGDEQVLIHNCPNQSANFNIITFLKRFQLCLLFLFSLILHLMMMTTCRGIVPRMGTIRVSTKLSNFEKKDTIGFYIDFFRFQ